MVEYVYAVELMIGILAAWDCWRRWLVHREWAATRKASADIDSIRADLDATKARLAEVITAVNFAKIRSGALARRGVAG